MGKTLGKNETVLKSCNILRGLFTFFEGLVGFLFFSFLKQ